MKQYETYSAALGQEEKLSGWRKLIAVGALAPMAITACGGNDAEAQPAPTVEQSADDNGVDEGSGANGEAADQNDSERDSEEPDAGNSEEDDFAGYDPLLGTYDDYSGATDGQSFYADTNIFSMMNPPFEYCDDVPDGEVCLDDYDEWNRYGYRLRNAEPIVVEWSKDHPQSHWEQTLAVGYYDGGEDINTEEHITVITPHDADRSH